MLFSSPNFRTCFTIGYVFLTLQLIFAFPFHGRIIGGEIAQPGQFPYIVSIQENVKEIDYNGHICGGSILNDQWIVTAAHCIVEPDLEDYQIIAGTNLLDTGGLTYNVTKLVVHPEFDISVITNDIALIRIDGRFDFTDTFIKTIKIGDVSGNESCTALGWGTTEDEDTPNGLHFVGVTALSPDDCSRLAADSEYSWLPRGLGHVCAFASKGKAVCHGDSGSPLVYNDQIVGIVSYALDTTCASGFPDVYTRVAHYSDWIVQTILENSL